MFMVIFIINHVQAALLRDHLEKAKILYFL